MEMTGPCLLPPLNNLIEQLQFLLNVLFNPVLLLCQLLVLLTALSVLVLLRQFPLLILQLLDPLLPDLLFELLALCL